MGQVTPIPKTAPRLPTIIEGDEDEGDACDEADFDHSGDERDWPTLRTREEVEEAGARQREEERAEAARTVEAEIAEQVVVEEARMAEAEIVQQVVVEEARTADAEMGEQVVEEEESAMDVDEEAVAATAAETRKRKVEEEATELRRAAERASQILHARAAAARAMEAAQGARTRREEERAAEEEAATLEAEERAKEKAAAEEAERLREAEKAKREREAEQSAAPTVEQQAVEESAAPGGDRVPPEQQAAEQSAAPGGDRVPPEEEQLNVHLETLAGQVASTEAARNIVHIASQVKNTVAEAGYYHIALCVTCYGRQHQLYEALTINLLSVWPCRLFLTVFLVLFEKDAKSTEAIRQSSAAQYEQKPVKQNTKTILEFYIGTKYEYCQYVLEALEWLYGKFANVIDSGLLRVAVCDGPHFSAPIAKNTSHNFALGSLSAKGYDPTRVFLMNLDADNVMSPQFVVGLLRQVRAGPQVACFIACGEDGGVTGRMGWWATTFAELGGYNEAMLPMAYQEVDMRERTKKLPGSVGVVVVSRTAGYSIPNHWDSKKARGEAKLANISDDLKHLLGGPARALFQKRR